MSKQHFKASNYKAQGSLGYLLKRSHSLMMDMLEPVLEEHGYSFVQYVILAWLREGIAIKPKDFCLQFRHDSGALTRVIDQLAERGLLERVRSGGDRRTVDLQITRAGRKAIEELIPLVLGGVNRALSDFTTEEVQELMRLLLKLNTTLQAAVESPTLPAVKDA